MPSDDTNLDAELRELMAAGRKIEAIKRYRETTGAGLAEAKAALEALERGGPLATGETPKSDLEAEIVPLLEQCRKIEAIKLYRDRTGAGLKEAKDAVEAIAADRRIVMPSGSGCLGVVLLALAVLAGASVLFASEKQPDGRFHDVTCEGTYSKHLQGICTDNKGSIFWCFTDVLVKTDRDGRLLKKVPVASHHGDLCYDGGNVYVAVNLGKFNQPAGQADSSVYVYSAADLAELARHRVPEVVHGAGGMAFRDGRFIIVGGLPKGFHENYAYEYDKDFKLIRRHVIKSGYTLLGIQTTTYCQGHWWFGCYGNPPVLLKTDSQFQLTGKYTCDGALGIVGLPDGSFLVARGTHDPGKGHSGRALIADADEQKGLVPRAGPKNVSGPDQPMKFWKEIDITPYKGTFPCLGDLDGDGKVDFLLYRQGPQTTPGYMVALNHEGQRLWEMGDTSIKSHMPDGAWKEPALRGIAFVYDIDQDGKAEVIAEFWQDDRPMLLVLDGATGKVKQSRESPFTLDIRGGKRSRCHPVGRVAHLGGRGKPPAIVLIYGASNYAPGRVAALDARLQTLWQLSARNTSVAHVPTVGDVNGDGQDEIVAGTALVDAEGRLLWEKASLNHADCTAIVDLGAEKTVLMSICNSGPACCLSAGGQMVWEKTTKDISHGQGIWAGNFMDKEPGLEAIILKSGHRGDFMTVRAKDGRELAAFEHRREKEGYPDFPCVVNWLDCGVHSLWIPIDRCLVDGYGNVVADLGSHEERVRSRLQWGTSKSHVAVQAFAVDLCGDERDELVLYQPYNGKSIFIFTQPDSDGREKPYVHQESVYQIQSYF